MQHDAIKFSFSNTLRQALRRRFRKIPSNAVIAREFNLRSHSAKTISQESVRRWLLGLSLPEYSHLQVLVRWLGIDTNSLFQTESVSLHGPPSKANIIEESLLPELRIWNRHLSELHPKHRQPIITLVDNLLSLSLERIEKTYMNFSEIVSSTQAAKAVPAASESIPRRPKGNNATFEKTAGCSPH